MCLYTIILEYDGGTYICQVEATNENDAVYEWVKAFGVAGLHVNTARALTKSFGAAVSEGPVSAVSGLVNAWCMTTLVTNKLALMNIIKTKR